MFKEKLKELIDKYAEKLINLHKPNLCTDAILVSKIEVDEAKGELDKYVDGLYGVHYNRFFIPETWHFTPTQFKYIYFFLCKESNTYFYDFLMEDENFSGYKYQDIESCKKDFEIFCKGL